MGGVGAAPPPPKPTQSRIRQGGQVQAAKLINKIQPSYPPLARQTRQSGTVRLHAIIAKNGSIQSLDVVSGPPLLQSAALEAVRQWRYQPTTLNGEAVEVETTIDVIFTLNQ
jgi:protein TonB